MKWFTPQFIPSDLKYQTKHNELVMGFLLQKLSSVSVKYTVVYVLPWLQFSFTSV